MSLQLFGTVNLDGSITIPSGSITLVSGSVTVLSGNVQAPNNVYTMEFDEMSINHVSGTLSYYAGVGVAISGSGFGGGVVGNKLAMYPTASAPYSTYEAFTTIPRNVRMVRYRMYTNMVGADFPAYDGNSNGPAQAFVNFGRNFLSGPNSANSDQYIQNLMRSSVAGQYDGNVWSLFYTGSISGSTNEIYDAGTLYKVDNDYTMNLAPTQYSPIYFTFIMSIGALFRTKTYKFKFELDIEDLGS